jgi:hypothetical protein
MRFYAVIDSDWVNSSKYSDSEKTTYLSLVKPLLADVRKIESLGLFRNFEIHHLDSFRGISNKPEKSLRIALLLRAYLRSRLAVAFSPSYDDKTLRRRPSFRMAPDIRFSIGIGEAEVKTKLSESDGMAFINAGRQITSMKGRKERIMIKTPWKEVNDEFEASLALLDAVISRWSAFQSEMVYYKILGKTENEIAELIQISQSAVNLRSWTSNYWAVDKLLERSEKLISKYTY